MPVVSERKWTQSAAGEIRGRTTALVMETIR
jgi:hypothetical protein